MLKWNEPLYLGKSVQSHERKIRDRLDQNQIDLGHYLITYAANERDQLDIINTSTLFNENLLKHLPKVIGIAGSRREAYEVVMQITEECLKENGDANLKNYIEKKAEI